MAVSVTADLALQEAGGNKRPMEREEVIMPADLGREVEDKERAL